MESKRLQWIYCTCSVRELDDYPVDISDVWLMVTHIRMSDGDSTIYLGVTIKWAFSEYTPFSDTLMSNWLMVWAAPNSLPQLYGMSQTSHDSLEGTALASWLVPLRSSK